MNMNYMPPLSDANSASKTPTTSRPRADSFAYWLNGLEVDEVVSSGEFVFI